MFKALTFLIRSWKRSDHVNGGKNGEEDGAELHAEDAMSEEEWKMRPAKLLRPGLSLLYSFSANVKVDNPLGPRVIFQERARKNRRDSHKLQDIRLTPPRTRGDTEIVER